MMKTTTELNDFYGLVTAKKGDTVTFGRYLQDDPAKKSSIEWLVGHVAENFLVLVSKRVLDAQPFNVKAGPVTWETSSLRSWLNGSFFNEAFSENEQEIIKEDLNLSYQNEDFNTASGKDTRDRVFCLDQYEVILYLTATGDRKAEPTPYAAQKQVMSAGKNCIWWLRVPGENETLVMTVNHNGEYYRTGMPALYKQAGVRPALKIDISACRAACRGHDLGIPQSKNWPKIGIFCDNQFFTDERSFFQKLLRNPYIGARALRSGYLAEVFKYDSSHSECCLKYAPRLTGDDVNDVYAYAEFLFNVSLFLLKMFREVPELGDWLLREAFAMALYKGRDKLENYNYGGFSAVLKVFLEKGYFQNFVHSFAIHCLDDNLDKVGKLLGRKGWIMERIFMAAAYLLTPDRSLIFNGRVYPAPEALREETEAAADHDFPALARMLYEGREDLEFLKEAFPDEASVITVNRIMHGEVTLHLGINSYSFLDLESFRKAVQQAKKDGHESELMYLRDTQENAWRMFSSARNADFLGELNKLTKASVTLGEYRFTGIKSLRSYLSLINENRAKDPLSFKTFVTFYREELDRLTWALPDIASDIAKLYDSRERLAVIGPRVFTDPVQFESFAKIMLASLSEAPEITRFFVSQHRENLEKLALDPHYGPAVLRFLNAEKEILSIDEHFFKDVSALSDYLTRLKQDPLVLLDFVRAHRKGITALLENPQASALARELLSQEALCRLKMMEPMDLKPGDIYPLGEFPYFPDGTPAPLEWLALRVTETDNAAGGNPSSDCETASALLISRYALDARKFHHDGSGVSWADSDLCAWLNGEFLETAFSAMERERILEEPLFTDTLSLGEDHGSRDSSAENSETAAENHAPAFKVFCLSADEAAEYFSSAEERRCAATPYALERGGLAGASDSGVSYWLRTPGLDGGSQVYADSAGDIVILGERADRQDFMVRPVIRIVFRKKSEKEPVR
ncbi:DUF6273 domain-containing protein [Succinimonas sp.]|uniref:DUF6273 domain-containing protein n=1 Tax=Succinimonas sp. TaxID=1936151 RepID=UPI003868925D